MLYVNTKIKFTAGALALAFVGCAKPEPPPPAPAEVKVVTAVKKDVPIFVELVGSTLGSEDIEIRPRVQGYLVSMNFVEGSYVRKGDLLYKIDPEPLEASLAESRANLATAQAQLEKTKNDVDRLTPLLKERAVSKQEVDNALSLRDAARSQVAAYEAKVAQSKLDLAYTTITSPTDGIIGTTKLKVGSLVGRGPETAVLNTVSKVDPIFFRCAMAEAEYLKISRRDSRPRGYEKQYGVELILADGTTHPYKGKLETVERAVDASTGTLTGQFSFPNPKRILRPNQYGRARFVVDVKDDAVLVPQRAVQEIQGLHSVMVVKPDSTVEQRMVKATDRVDDQWVIESGIKPGESVIVEGAQKVTPGAKVVASVEKPAGAASAASNEAPPMTEASAVPAKAEAKNAKGK
ncbi:MAG TPA: efflux RND transporter periplasmic adaptor subunit [Candidatus Binatia bacterium]|jgi:membrane fusion protein (multidrug efflux system)